MPDRIPLHSPLPATSLTLAALLTLRSAWAVHDAYVIIVMTLLLKGFLPSSSQQYILIAVKFKGPCPPLWNLVRVSLSSRILKGKISIKLWVQFKWGLFAKTEDANREDCKRVFPSAGVAAPGCVLWIYGSWIIHELSWHHIHEGKMTLVLSCPILWKSIKSLKYNVMIL